MDGNFNDLHRTYVRCGIAFLPTCTPDIRGAGLTTADIPGIAGHTCTHLMGGAGESMLAALPICGVRLLAPQVRLVAATDLRTVWPQRHAVGLMFVLSTTGSN